MDIRREQYQKILEKYPEVISIRGNDFLLHFKISEEILLEVDFRKYPKKLKAYLIRNQSDEFKLSRLISSLRYWKGDSSVSVLEIVEEILQFVENIKFNQIMIKREFLEGLIDMCKKNHPQKMKAILGLERGIVSEYIVPSRACTSDTKEYEYLRTACTIPLDFSYAGTFISRPSGSLSTNEKLNEVFKKRRFTMLLAHPYDISDNLKCFGTSGQILEYIIID